jgi:hypothetical protein
VGFKGSRGPVIIGIIAFILIIAVIGIAASGGAPKKAKAQADIAVVTINAEIGVDYVQILNMRTGGQNIKSSMNLPYSFNCTVGDTLRITASNMPGYLFNTWEFDSGTFNDDNPLTIKINGDTSITGTVLINIGGLE